MNPPLISIIMPVYNTEEYLNKAIDSILSQTNDNFEIVIINDGSTDSSGSICDLYAEKDPRVIVIHQQNGGVSRARNVGLSKASGDYIVFIDSDDTMSENVLSIVSSALDSIDQKDIYFCNFNTLLDHSGKTQLVKCEIEYDPGIIERADPLEILANLLTGNSSIWTIWRHIFRRDLLVVNNIAFDERLAAAEDMDFFINTVLASKEFGVIDVSICNYRPVRKGSITYKKSYKAIISEINVQKFWFDYSDELAKKTSSDSAEKIRSRFANFFCDCIGGLHSLDKEEQEKIQAYVKENEYMLAYVTGNKYHLAVSIYKLFGFKLSIRILFYLYTMNFHLRLFRMRKH